MTGTQRSRRFMREVNFHEDDYCQLELVSEQNEHFCNEQMQKVSEFAAAHQAEVGWTDVYVRSANPVPLSSVKITRSDFARCMPVAMEPFDQVLTGCSSFRTECKRTIAFGPHPSLVAFAELDDGDIVQAVWFTFDLASQEDVEIAMELMRGLACWPVLVADWGWSRLFHVNDIDAFESYFQQRMQVFGENKSRSQPKRPWWKFW